MAQELREGAGEGGRLISCLEVYELDTGARRLLKAFDGHVEAPNWFPDGRRLLYNAGGRLYAYELATGESSLIDTGRCQRCNNDHVLSADGRWLGISSGTAEDGRSRVWLLPAAGGEPRLLTELAPSYLHGISPDGQTFAYCAERGGEYDIYAIGRAPGAQERRLTDAPGLDDGPEYSPDGRHIWFNSVRSGLMQLWRMNADGSGQTQMTDLQDRNCWFPHLSPDGRRLVFIAYRKGDVAPGDHPANRQVEIYAMDAAGGEPRLLFRLFGGQGSLNVNSWSPQGDRFAFVSYRFE